LIEDVDGITATTITKSGAGVLVLTGANTYTGPTLVTGGTLRAQDGMGLTAGSNLVLSGGVFETSGSFTRALGAGAGQVQLTGSASGFSAFGGALQVNLGGSGELVTWGSPFFDPSALVLNAASADSALEFQNDLDLNGLPREISVQANTATITGEISDSGTSGYGGLTKTGNGVLALASANSYGGITTLLAGTLALGNDGALGTSTMVLGGGVFQSTGGARVLENNFEINGNTTFSGASSITIEGSFTNTLALPQVTNNITGGGNTLTFNGPVYLSNDNTSAGRYLSFFGSGTTVINGVVANNPVGGTLAAGFFYNGGGTLFLNGENTYTGRTLVGTGTVVIGQDRNLGSAPASPFVDSIIIAVGGKLRADGTFALDPNRTIGIGSSAGSSAAAQVTGTIEVTAGNTLTIGGLIADRTNNMQDGSATPANVGALTKANSGKLILTGNNTYTGLTTVSGGILEIRHAGALGGVTNAVGATSAGTVVGANAALQLAGGITVGPEHLTLNGTGISGGGALRNAEGNNTYTGPIVLGATARIHSDLDTLTLDAASGPAIENIMPTGSRTLFLGGAGDIVVADGIMQTGAGVLNLEKDGIGTVTLQGANAINGTIGIVAGRLVLDYNAGNTVLTTTQVLLFRGGTVEVQGDATLGNITLNASSGLNTLVVGEDTALTLGNTWTRNSSSLLFIDLSAEGASLLSSPGSTETKTIATGVTASMVTGGGFAAYTMKDSAGRYDFAAVSGGEIVRLNATLALPSSGGSTGSAYLYAPVTASSTLTLTGAVNSGVVRVDTSSSEGVLDLNGFKLVVNDLGFLVDGANDFTLTDSSIAKTGNLEGTSSNPALFIYHYGTGTLTIDAKLSSGIGSLAFAGEGGLVDWRTASNASGTTNIQGSVLRVSHAEAILLTNATTGVGSQFVNLSNGGILELATGDLTRNLGTSGSGNLGFLAGDGGGFSAYGGDRVVNLANSSGSLDVTWGAGGFLASGSKLILGSAYADSQVDFQNDLSLGGANQVVEVQSDNVADVGGKLSGVISSATGSLLKTGQGILEVTGDNTYGGGTVVKEGTFLANNTSGSATGSGNVTVLAGGRLGGRGTVGNATTARQIEVRTGATLMVGQLGDTAGQVLQLQTGGTGVITLAGTVEFDLYDNNGAANPWENQDVLSLSSETTVVLEGTLRITDLTDEETDLSFGSSWQLIDWTNVLTGEAPRYSGGFTTYDVPELAEGLMWDYSQLYTAGVVSISYVPEPGRAMLLLGGIAVLLLRRRRR
jgi:autotransporter-associated beta strand protein